MEPPRVAFSIPVEPHLFRPFPTPPLHLQSELSVPPTDRDNFLFFCNPFRALDICLHVSSCQNSLPLFFLLVSFVSFFLVHYMARVHVVHISILSTLGSSNWFGILSFHYNIYNHTIQIQMDSFVSIQKTKTLLPRW
jgi:hypothetical protein